MAFFTDNDLERLDWRLLQNGCINLYWRSKILNEDVSWLEKHCYQINSMDCSGWDNLNVLHDAFAEELKFPDWYGKNLDALNDCLSDLEIAMEGGRVIVLRGFDGVAAKIPEAAQGVMHILAKNARRFLLFGKRLIVLVQSDDPKISFDPVGAQPVGWNPRERLNKNRGL